MIRLAGPLTLLAVAAPLAAAELTVAKSTAVVSDGVNTLRPRALPQSVVDYRLLVTNPLANAVLPVRRVVISDPVPVALKLRVLDLAGQGGGPVEFTDGNLLNLGLLGSGLGFRFGGVADQTDSVEFWDGTDWRYTPVADADGCDAKVRAIRVTLANAQVAGSGFQLRYRVILR